MILIPRFFLTGCLHWSATEKTKVTKATVSELFATETFLNLAEETKAVIEAAVGVFRKFNRSWSETKVVISDEDFFREKHLRNVFRKLLTVFIEFKSVNTYWVGRQIIFSEIDLTVFSSKSYISLYMMWMLHALWLVVAYDLLEYRYMDDITGNLFTLFCWTWHAVLKMFLRLFWIKGSESLQKT